MNKDHHLIILFRSYLTYDFFFEAVITIFPIIPQVLQYSANITAFWSCTILYELQDDSYILFKLQDDSYILFKLNINILAYKWFWDDSYIVQN